MADYTLHGDEAIVIDRIATAKRFLFTVLFVIVVRLLEAVLAFVVLYELIYTLITKRSPNARVTRFAHRILCYGFDIGQYITCNKNQRPFPFEDLPIGIEPIDPSSAATP
ncbi:MAG: DUF4389 domain-containing protein [Pirellulales bacterium]